MMAASGLAPLLAARAGQRATMSVGIVLGGSGLALMAVLVSAEGGYLAVLPGMLAMGLGKGAVDDSFDRGDHQRAAT